MENTLIEILNKSINYLEKQNKAKARLLAESIFSEVLKLKRIELYTNFEKKLSSDEINIIKKRLKYIDENKVNVYDKTVKNYIEKTKNYLEKKDYKDALMLTNIIFSNILNVELSLLFTKYSNNISNEQINKLKIILKKLVEDKIPIQYIFNEQIFYGHKFYVDNNVLIPRLDTETVVEKGLDLIKDIDKPLILDIGTGSGAIGITIALENNETKVLATDISMKALNVSKLNASNLGVKNIKFLLSDIFSNITYNDFDLIISNPPYISLDEKYEMGEEVLIHEPHLALFSKENGLYFYYEISKNAKKYMKDGAYLLFEIGYKQGKSVKEILENFGYIDIKIGKDLNNKERYVYARKGINESK